MPKPKIFISHITEESELAEILKSHFTNDFLNMVDVFVASDSTSIPLGNRWLDDIDRALKQADIEIILCSERSVIKPWINFEAGAGWIRGIPVVPVCHSGLRPSDLPIPLGMLQAIEANQISGLKRLYILLADAMKASTPDIDFSQISEEIKNFEARYQATGQQGRTDTEIEEQSGRSNSGDKPAQTIPEKGLVEGQEAVQQLAIITLKIVDEINNVVSKVNSKLERYGRGQDGKIAQQIANDLRTGSSKIERLLPQFKDSIQDITEFLSSYTNWLLEKPEKDKNEQSVFRLQISELVESLKTPLQRTRSHRNSIHNLRILSADVKRVSDRFAKALNEIIKPMEELRKVCLNKIELIDSELGKEDTENDIMTSNL